MKHLHLTILIIANFAIISCVSQKPDMNVDMTVESPFFNGINSPVVLFDAGHQNFHSINTTYQPFAALLKNDGISIQEYKGAFERDKLTGADLLIIANALPPESEAGKSGSAFTDDEVQVLSEWVFNGGSLLLIADHDPFGSAAAGLAKAFSVQMESVWTVDTLRKVPGLGKNTWLEFTNQNNGLGRHAILQKGSSTCEVKRVITFTGQSLGFDSTWTSILNLSNAARNYYNRSDASVASADTSTYFQVPGQSQLIAREYGRGRIVVAGEAAMFTAQVARIFMKTIRAGFNYPGYDNKKLIVNITHWLLNEI